MANAAVVDCYAVMTEGFGSMAGRTTPHRGADYRRSAGQVVVAYEETRIIAMGYSSYLGYWVVGIRTRDGRAIGWAHLRTGTRPDIGTVVPAGGSVGIVAGYGENPGSSWSGPHIHTTEDDGADWEHIYQGQNSDPVPDITAAKAGVAGGGSTPISDVDYAWGLTGHAVYAGQRLLNRILMYGGVDGGTGPEDQEAGPRFVKGFQELFKRWGYLPGDYGVDGIPHNADKNAPSSYGYAMQRWVDDKSKYGESGGLQDGIPGPKTAEYFVKACDRVIWELDNPGKQNPEDVVVPPPVVTPPTYTGPVFPPSPEGYFFFPDVGTSQGDMNMQEFYTQGGRTIAIKAVGANASDAPYIAPRFADQLSRSLAVGLRIIKYVFNGRKNGQTPESMADFFALHGDLKPGQIVAIDCEREDDTDTDPWTVDECRRFIVQLRTHFPGILGLIYASDSLFDAWDWTPVKALGWGMWNASWGQNTGDPGTVPGSDEWITPDAWQYTSKEKVPGNFTGNPPVYGDTDGNLAKHDLFDRFAWKLPVEPEEPEPTIVTAREILDSMQAFVTEWEGKVAA